MRTRNIKPGFFKNDELAEIEPLGRLLFAGLWCMADREGRLCDRPKRIKVEILPYDDCDVDALLNQLASKGFIVRYKVNDEAYIQIVNFSKHQNPHKNEPQSSIPAPFSESRTAENPNIQASQQDDGDVSEEYGASTVQVPYKYDTSTVQEPEEHSANREDIKIKDIKIKDIKIKDHICVFSQTHECDVGENPSESSSRKKKPKVTYETEFELIWSVYPRKKEKQAAYKCFLARVKEGHRPRDMLLAAQRYRDECARLGTEERFIKHAKTFFGPNKPFLDYLQKEVSGNEFADFADDRDSAKFYQ